MKTQSPKSFEDFEAKRVELEETLKELRSLGWTIGELPGRMPTVLDAPYLKSFLSYYKETQID